MKGYYAYFNKKHKEHFNISQFIFKAFLEKDIFSISTTQILLTHMNLIFKRKSMALADMTIEVIYNHEDFSLIFC